MKTLSTLILILSATLSQATRFEFVNPFFTAPLGAEETAAIETNTPTGVNVPVLDAVVAFQARGIIGTTLGLPDIPAPLFTSLDGWTILGTMTWDLEKLIGFWSLSSPPILTEFGPTQYVVRTDGIDSKWPLEYQPSQSFLRGEWHAVPDTGSTLVLCSLGLLAIFCAKRAIPQLA